MNSSSIHHRDFGLDGLLLSPQFHSIRSLKECLASYSLATTLASVFDSQHPRRHGLLAWLWTVLSSHDHVISSISTILLAHLTIEFLSRKLSNINISKISTLGHHPKVNHLPQPASGLKPLLFPARTTHRRLFPTPHSFSYSYLLAGIPITNSSYVYSSLISSHSSGNEPPAWFSVYATDYLIRGSSLDNLSFRHRLDEYLNSQNIDPADFPNAYLVTAPRFLGFSFNPVSFWYLYRKDGRFSAMILEVNNTFDERRMYFLGRAHDSNEIAGQEDIEESSPRFTFLWKKDFHVSPFNDRDGSYSVSAVDVRSGIVDVTIVLRNDNEKAKIIARVFSTESGLKTAADLSRSKSEVGKGIDPVTMSIFKQVKFLLSWSWVGFFTNPRILREARILWVKKLKVFYRPEPKLGTFGRSESPEEVVLEAAFDRFLQMLADQFDSKIVYRSAAGSSRGKAKTSGYGAREVAVTVLTPEFYAEMARWKGSMLELFEKVVLTDAADKLVHVSDEVVMREILESNIKKGPCSMRSKSGDMKAEEIAAFSGIDEGSQGKSLKRYHWAARRIRLANRIAFGSRSLLAFEIRFVRAIGIFVLTIMAVKHLSG